MQWCLSDVSGDLLRDGLDMDEIMDFLTAARSVAQGLRCSQFDGISNEELLTQDVDIRFPLLWRTR